MFPCERVAYPVWTRDLVAYLQLKPNHCQVILYHLTKLNWALSLPLLIILLNTGHYQLGVRPFFFRFGKRKEKKREERGERRCGERFPPDKQIRRKAFPRAHHPPTPRAGPTLRLLLLLCSAGSAASLFSVWLLCSASASAGSETTRTSSHSQHSALSPSITPLLSLPPSLYRQQVCTAQLHCEETVTRREAEEPPLLPSLSSLHHHPSLIYWSKPPRGCSWAGPDRRVVSPWFAAGVHKHHREREGAERETRRACLGLEGRGWEQEGKEKGRRRRW